MNPLLRRLFRHGVRRGLSAGGSRGWLAVGLAAGTVAFLRRKVGEPKVQFTEKLKPGQSMTIRHLGKGEAETV